MMKRLTCLCVVLLALVAPFALAEGQGEGEQEPVLVTSIEIEKIEPDAALRLNRTLQLTARVRPEGASDPSIEWLSSDEQIATVDDSGLVRGVALGEVEITCRALDGSEVEGTIRLTVEPVLVRRITLIPMGGENAIRIGETLEIAAVIEPGDATDPRVTWHSSDESIATVDENGLVKGLGVGRAIITAKAVDAGAASGVLEIEVVATPVSSIRLSILDKRLMQKGEWPVQAYVQPENPTDPRLVWSSSDEDIARVEVAENGSVRVVAGEELGQAVIRARAKDGGGAEASARITVMTPVTGIVLMTPEDASEIDKGDALPILAAVLPSDASDELEWSSSNEKVARVVLEHGQFRVLGVAGGSAVISAAAQDGSRIKGSMSIDVQVPLEGVSLPDEANAFVGRDCLLAPTFSPEDTTYRRLRWESANPFIASVDSRGNVVGMGVGTTYIRAISTVNSGIMGMSRVTVTKPITTIALYSESTAIGKGGKTQINAALSPVDAGDKGLAWSSSNESIATVDENGLVTGVGAGVVVIRAKARDGGGASGVITLEVRGALERIMLPKEISVLPGEQYQFSPVTLPLGIDPGPLTWASGDERIVRIDEHGKLVGIMLGETYVSVTAQNGVSARCSVRVSLKLASIEVRTPEGALQAGETYEINLGERRQMSASALPTGIDVKMAWLSSAPSVASVSDDGQITARKTGLGRISVTAVEEKTGTRVVRSFPVRVIQPVTGVMLPEKIALLAGRSLPVKAVIAPKGATHTGLVWASGDEAVVRMSAKGVATGVAPGETIITATAHNQQVAVSRAVVRQPVQSIALNLPEIEGKLNPGASFDLTWTVLPAEAGQELIFSSSNKAVATVSAEGRVAARKAGSARITATAQDGSGVKASVTIKIYAPVTGMKLSRKTATLFTNGGAKTAPFSFTLKGTLLPSGVGKRAIHWSSSDESVASVSESGKVQAVGDGIAIITGRSENAVSAQCVVTVRTLPTQISLEESERTLETKERFDLSPYVETDGSDLYLAWKSSNTRIAKVSKDGVVAAVKPGKARISVRTRNGRTASCLITVAKPEL